MKKIPTLFKRIYDNHKIVGITPEVTEGMDCILMGAGVATVKHDGACCAVINGKFYKRYDAKKGKKNPKDAIQCQKLPDPVTGHFPCWVPIEKDNPADKWFIAAWNNSFGERTYPKDGTYEAIGKHFQGNPYHLKEDTLVPHGCSIIDVDRTFYGIKEFLKNNYIEGIVFWKDGEPKCKIKRSDFGYEWGNK